MTTYRKAYKGYFIRKNMEKKDFFKRRTEAEIRDLGNEIRATNKLVSRITDMPYDSHLVVARLILPEEYLTPSKFKKHAPELKLRRAKTIEQLRKQKILPVKQRQEAFDSLHNQYQETGHIPFLSGYITRPPEGAVDQIPRKIALVSCLDGAEIFGYAHQVPGVEIKLKDYDDSKISTIEGGRFVFQVPSRTPKHSRWDVGLESVAVEDNDWKYVIAQNIDSDHTCPEKRFNRELRFKYLPNRGRDRAEKSKVIQFCPHDVAPYLELADTLWNQDKNIVPLAANPFALPTQETVDFYKKLLNNVLIEYKTKAGVLATRHLNQAEQEAFLWGYVAINGHDKTFFATQDLKQYDWSVK